MLPAWIVGGIFTSNPSGSDQFYIISTHGGDAIRYSPGYDEVFHTALVAHCAIQYLGQNPHLVDRFCADHQADDFVGCGFGRHALTHFFATP
jgi:hypothetical protein